MLEVRLLGTFAIQRDGQPVAIASRSAQSLFAYLILTAGNLHRREKLAGMFWPDTPEAKARAYLRHELWRIRRLFSTKSDDRYLLSDDINISFNASSNYWLDVAVLESSEQSASIHELMNALSVYQGELLPDFYEDWTVLEREHLRSIYEQKITRLLEMLEKKKYWGDILEWAERWISIGQGPEAAYRALMIAYDALGERRKVASTFERCVHALGTLGLEPSEETRALAFKLNHSLNIPIPLTSFIGRENEIKEVADLLSRSRLVTLTGAGGVGKTRLAIQVVSDAMERFPDGVWFLDLAPLSDPGLVPATLAKLLGLYETGELPISDLLVNYFHSRNALIIFDNCEHLIEACAQIVYSLLSSCEHLSVLATSREALRVAGEVPYRVPSLELPKVESEPGVETLQKSESVRLFLDRARADAPGFVITPENGLTVAQICKRLDGIPLAIELAAARINVLTVQEILKRLDDRFNLLTRGMRTALPRQQTLWATIEWSFSLLPEEERILFRRLAVFSGGWTLEAAEAVCSGEGIKSADVLDLLSQLVNKSLVVVESRAETRYRRLEIIREFAREKLIEATEAGRLQDRHLNYFLKLAETAEPHLRKAEQIEWLKRLDTDYENLRTALAWALGKPSAERVLRLAGALGSFWYLRSYCQEGARWLDQALRKTSNQNSKPEIIARAKALYRRADIAETLDEFDVMKTSAESALALCEQVDDAWGIAFSHALIAHRQLRLGMLNATFWASLEHSLTDFRRLGDSWGESRALQWQAYVFTETGTGTREEFLELIQGAIARARDSGDRARIAFSLVGLATGLMGYGQWDQAEIILQEAEQLYAELDSSDGINGVRFWRIHNFFAGGDLEKAKAEAKQVIEYWDRVGEKNQQGTILCILALIADAEHDVQSAIAYAQKALELAREMRLPLQIAWALALVGLGKYQMGQVEVALEYVRDSLELVGRCEGRDNLVLKIFDHLAGLLIENKTQAALQILAFTESLVQLSAVRRDPIFDKPYFDRFLSAARSKVSDAELTSAWAAGSKLSLDEAITCILREL